MDQASKASSRPINLLATIRTRIPTRNHLWNGNPPSGGNTGNAVNFVSPVNGSSYGGVPGATGPATAGLLANGTNIGGNYFSDTFGAPTSNFVAPTYTGAAGSSYSPPLTNPGNALTSQVPSSTGFGLSGPGSNLGDVAASNSGGYASAPADAGSVTVYDSGLTDTGAIDPQVTPTNLGSATPSAQTVPAAINAQTAGQTQDAQAAANATTAAANANDQTATGLLGSAQQTVYNIFVRFGIVALGIAFVVIGLNMMRGQPAVSVPKLA